MGVFVSIQNKVPIRKIIGVKMIGAAFVLLGISITMLTLIRPNIVRVCEYNTKAATLGVIDGAINDRLGQLGDTVNYSSLIRLSYTEGGQVSSIETNTALINRIKTDMLTDINNQLLNGLKQDIKLSAGTLSGIPIFNGSGPTVSMRIEPKGYADAIFISEFTDAGLNQTLHRIIMRTSVSVTAFIPLYSIETQVSGDFLIAETVIVGDVPESFTHVVSADKDIVDNINDFEAEPYD